MALTKSGNVEWWGSENFGIRFNQISLELHNVIDIASSFYSHCALTASGRAVVWGHSRFPDSIRAQLQSGVKQIVGNPLFYAALKNDGSVIFWSTHGDIFERIIFPRIYHAFQTGNHFSNIRIADC